MKTMTEQIADASPRQLKAWEKGLRNGSAGGWTLGDRNALVAEIARRGTPESKAKDAQIARYTAILRAKSNAELIAHHRSVSVQGGSSSFGSDAWESAMDAMPFIEAEMTVRMSGWAAV